MNACTYCKKTVSETEPHLKLVNYAQEEKICHNCWFFMSLFYNEPRILMENSITSAIEKTIKTYDTKVIEMLQELSLLIKNKKQAATARTKKRFGKKERAYILEKFEHKCSICKKELEKNYIHIDHIIPISKGGTNNIQNLQVLCVECNLKKTNFTRSV